MRALAAVVLGWTVLLSSPSLSTGLSETNEGIENARVLLRQGQLERALPLLAAEIQGSGAIPEQAWVDNAVGWIYLQQGNFLRAELHLNSALARAKETEDDEALRVILNNLGISRYLQNDFDGARTYFDTEPAATSQTAATYLQLVARKESEFLGQQAIERGLSNRWNRNFVAAIEDYSEALLHRPADARLLDYKGYALLRAGDLEAAEEALLEARHLDPRRLPIHLNLAKVYCKQDREDKVLETVLESGLDLDQYKDWFEVDAEFRRLCGRAPFERIMDKAAAPTQ